MQTHIGGLFVVVYIVHIPGEAKVSDLHHVVLRHKDVSGRQVSVDTLGVGGTIASNTG